MFSCSQETVTEGAAHIILVAAAPSPSAPASTTRPRVVTTALAADTAPATGATSPGITARAAGPAGATRAGIIITRETGTPAPADTTPGTAPPGAAITRTETTLRAAGGTGAEGARDSPGIPRTNGDIRDVKNCSLLMRCLYIII